MAQAIFKGRIVLDGVTVPVKLYAAVSDRRVHFRLLHEADQVPVQQRMVNPETGKDVPNDEVRTGFEVEDGRFVVLEDEELAALEPEPSRDIEVLQFVRPDQIGAAWYVRPYYLGPDGPAQDYAALVRALEQEKKVGIVRWVMRKRVYRGALRAEGGHLVLITLRSAGEVIAADALPAPPGRALSEQETKMAQQLVDMLAGKLDMSAFHDEVRDRVAELVREKAAGHAPKLPKPKTKPETDDLLHALKASVESRKGRKVA